MRSDGELLDAWRAGDRRSGELLMRRHYRSVLRFFELNASWAAEDLAQRTFMACIERSDQVRDASAFRSYLFGIARRQLAMHQRDLVRTLSLRSFDDAQPRGRSTRLSTLVARGKEQILALRAMASMPRRDQVLLILFYWEGVATPELSENFGVPASTVRSRLARARDLLKRRMGELAAGEFSPTNDERLRQVMEALVARPDLEAAMASVLEGRVG